MGRNRGREEEKGEKRRKERSAISGVWLASDDKLPRRDSQLPTNVHMFVNKNKISRLPAYTCSND